jgi:hypothetical protein
MRSIWFCYSKNIMDVWHLLRIIEIETPVPKLCISHSEKHEIAYVITVKDNNSERKCGIRAPTPGEHNETNTSE